MKKILDWIKSLFTEEYELCVWFHAETTVSSDGMKTVTRSKRVFKLSSITKRSPSHIIGKDVNGFPFEIRTVEPFDYTIRKTR